MTCYAGLKHILAAFRVVPGGSHTAVVGADGNDEGQGHATANEGRGTGAADRTADEGHATAGALLPLAIKIRKIFFANIC